MCVLVGHGLSQVPRQILYSLVGYGLSQVLCRILRSLAGYDFSQILFLFFLFFFFLFFYFLNIYIYIYIYFKSRSNWTETMEGLFSVLQSWRPLSNSYADAVGQVVWVFPYSWVLSPIYSYVPLHWSLWSGQDLQCKLYHSDPCTRLPCPLLNLDWPSVYLAYQKSTYLLCRV
jgi:hypothetical protein